MLDPAAVFPNETDLADEAAAIWRAGVDALRVATAAIWARLVPVQFARRDLAVYIGRRLPCFLRPQPWARGPCVRPFPLPLCVVEHARRSRLG